MSSACYRNAAATFSPLLYTYNAEHHLLSTTLTRRLVRSFASGGRRRQLYQHTTPTSSSPKAPGPPPPLSLGNREEPDELIDHLNPPPDSYSSTPFTDHCTLALHAGSGGHGCISFVREKYIAAGPANGGDGGSGGSVYIQADPSITSLHKLARQGLIRAERGKNGSGKGRGGERGADVLITVPVGTIVREIERYDAVEEAEAEYLLEKKAGRGAIDGDQRGKWRKEKWLLYPGSLPSSFVTTDFPALPRPRRSNLTQLQPPKPMRLDLDKPMETPMLLAAGAMGGLGNPHFVTKSIGRPKFATKGEQGMRLRIELELKILADVGLVGLPNAGKSTLLRALSRSRARVGDWAFTTLQPNIGTVVLDDYKGRPRVGLGSDQARAAARGMSQRTNFTIADIPGLVEDAHLDRGLGLGFLRHIERAKVLAFVVDLSLGDAWEALVALWREVGEYETLRERELNADTERRDAGKEPLRGLSSHEQDGRLHLGQFPRQELSRVAAPVSSKPWLVVATKADLEGTQEKFSNLQEKLQGLSEGHVEHPSRRKNGWRKDVRAVPVSAIRGEGVEQLPALILRLLDEASESSV